MMQAMILCFALSAAIGGTEADAQGAASDPPAEPLHGIHEALRDIGESLRAIRHDQRALLFMRRIELAERRLDPLESDLRSARADARNLEEEIERLGAYQGSVQETVDRKVREGADPARVQEKEELRQIELALENLRTNLDRAEARTLEMENQLTRARRQVESLDDQLREWLNRTDE